MSHCGKFDYLKQVREWCIISLRTNSVSDFCALCPVPTVRQLSPVLFCQQSVRPSWQVWQVTALVWVVNCVLRCYALSDAHCSCVASVYTLAGINLFSRWLYFLVWKTVKKWWWLECQLLHNVQPRPMQPHGYGWHNQPMQCFERRKHFTLSSIQTALLAIVTQRWLCEILIATLGVL